MHADYTTALEKIAGESADTADSTAEGTKGVAATAAEYVRDGARTVAQKAKEVCYSPPAIIVMVQEVTAEAFGVWLVCSYCITSGI